ncbi:ribosome small subunit-dependent GTPase A [Deinococcus radiotolerans]|uniref:Small ribosomal subunit biogenesis GTPase RsgA n=1 Tax=Deinococcus radiotolerans TaxID=1309407 RepID=A0ABQ2FIZ2_9DEIO|nr:ribosome small subunit-dependent GTPase A [Deinococcus radiotolerans]GGL00366.1 ribosome small subunit-dependent GTPase [Deinococcus radiotolerans]
MNLAEIGWTPEFEQAAQAVRAAAPGVELQPGRVAGVGRNTATLWTEGGALEAVFAGTLRQADVTPVVGDWVMAEAVPDAPLRVHAVLPRRTQLARAVQAGMQVLSANVDVVLVMTAPDGDIDEARLSRYLEAVRVGGARAALLLNKVDLTRKPEAVLAQLRALDPAVAVLPLRATVGEGVAEVRELIGPGETAALIGSSGMGKSTLTNALLGREVAQTGEVGATREGRHTTTARTLYRLPGGGVLVDNPGLRDIEVWREGEAGGFEDIEALAAECRFRKCTHGNEPGCAVQRAVSRGQLSEERVEAYRAAQGFTGDRQKPKRRK